MVDDSLPTVLRDLASALEAELMNDSNATVELPQPVEWVSWAALRAKTPGTVGAGSPAPAPVATAKPAASRVAAVPAVAESSASASHPTPVSVVSSSSLEEIAAQIASCKACPLAASRTHTVPGIGRLAPEVMFIGEGPGADEDAQGVPFVGRAGELLTKMIAAMGYSREEVYIANIVKCRPPENRKPAPEEMSACFPFLQRQIEQVRPKTIVALGATAIQGLLHTNQGINALRGHWLEYQGIPVMPTFHPAYLLRMPVAKREAWSDLKQVMAKVAELRG